MERLKYGTKEIIATVLGAALFVLAEWTETGLIDKGLIPASVYAWVQLRVLVVAIVAAFFGPVSGVFCGIGGDLLINVMYESVISYPEVISLGLYGFLVGFSFYRMKGRSADYGARGFVDFNAIQLAVAIFCALFTVPLLRFIIEDVELHYSIGIGARSVVGNSLLIGIICPLLLFIVNAVAKGRKGTKSRRT